MNKNIFFSFLQFLSAVVFAQPSNRTRPVISHILQMKMGPTATVSYDLDKGDFDFFTKGQKTISGAYSLVKCREEIYKSKNYDSRVERQKAFVDAIGAGTRYEIEHRRKDWPTMLQVFYIYKEKDFFIVEVSLKGQAMESNYMVPLIAEDADIHAIGDNRTLFVPFDNDAFISYNAKSMGSQIDNTSAEVGAVYENGSRSGLVIGSVDQTVWKTGIRTAGTGSQLTRLEALAGYTDAAVTRDTIPHGFIKGSTITSPKIFVGYFSDWRQGLETYAKASRILNKPYISTWTKPTPFGWNSWGVMQDHITYEKAIAVADFFGDSLPGFRNGNTLYIDLDSYWDKLAIGGIEGELSQLKKFVSHCKSKGLQAGIYWGPFTDWGWGQANSGSRKMEGSHYLYGDAWTKTGGHFHNIDGARALDPTHPGTQQRIALYMSKFKDCGFKMIKIDFLGHAAIESDKFFDSTVTTGMQAYRKGMEYLVDQAGNDMLIYAAISPNMATANYVHARRIACDAFKSISDSRYTLNSVNYGWWQTFIYNFIDADHIVFGSEGENINRVRLTSGLITGTLITGDDYATKGPWRNVAKKLLQNAGLLAIAKNGKAFRPLEGNSGDSTNAIFQLRIGAYMYVAIFNFSNEIKNFKMDYKRLGLAIKPAYEAVEIYTDTRFKDLMNVELPANDAAIFKIKM